MVMWLSLSKMAEQILEINRRNGPTSLGPVKPVVTPPVPSPKGFSSCQTGLAIVTQHCHRPVCSFQHSQSAALVSLLRGQCLQLLVVWC